MQKRTDLNTKPPESESFAAWILAAARESRQKLGNIEAYRPRGGVWQNKVHGKEPCPAGHKGQDD
ncbi:hypothetical protein [Salipiger bermudensis]|uniref:hypothetical protein n=1 Tax=Salipiger bermudensis TaxID=344736 RepID=UPI0011849686|nr:hypothetical protein [Salipiger bermudensis]MBR9890896.1 hypothetical protein [bacterium]MCA1285379.1 hypothetical protein [Salipiger bermudensis]